MERDTIFISYASEDLASRDELLKQLEVILGRPHEIPIFADSTIDVGEKWHARIVEELDRSLVVVLLVSADFLNSKFVKTVELPRAALAERRGDVRIASLYVRPCPAENFHINVDNPEGDGFEVRVTDYQGINAPSKALMLLSAEADREQLYASAANDIVRLARA
jgi:hypothetical protein